MKLKPANQLQRWYGAGVFLHHREAVGANKTNLDLKNIHLMLKIDISQ